MATNDITRIVYGIVQGEATVRDFETFATYAQEQLATAYPGAEIVVETSDHETDGCLIVETREDTDDDTIGALYRAREEAEDFIGRLWDRFGSQ